MVIKWLCKINKDGKIVPALRKVGTLKIILHWYLN